VSNWNSVMIRNRADTYGGGGYVGIYHHCTVVNNQAGEGYGGGGIYRGAVYNSIIYYNFCTNACMTPRMSGARMRSNSVAAVRPIFFRAITTRITS
jgi:hypothetical protein